MDIQTQLSHRRIVLDSRFGNPMSGSRHAGSHFEVQLQNALNIPRGGQMRVDSVSFPHSNVTNVSVRNNKVYWIEKRVAKGQDSVTNVTNDYYRSAEIPPQEYTNATFASALDQVLTTNTNFHEQIRYDYTGTYQGFGSTSQGHTITVQYLTPNSQVAYVTLCGTNSNSHFGFEVDTNSLNF